MKFDDGRRHSKTDKERERERATEKKKWIALKLLRIHLCFFVCRRFYSREGERKIVDLVKLKLMYVFVYGTSVQVLHMRGIVDDAWLPINHAS